MAVKNNTSTEYKNFPAADEASRKNRTLRIVVPLLIVPVMVLLNFDSLMPSVLLFVVLVVLAEVLVWSFHDPCVLKAMFASLVDLTAEQRKAFVRIFMHGKPLGRGDMQQASVTAGRLQKAALDMHNNKISREQYISKVQSTLASYQNSTAAKG